MEDIKMSVTIELQGSKMMTPQECGENPKNYDRHFMMLDVKHYDKKTKKTYYRKEPLNFRTRKYIPAHQSINMSQDAYDYMISASCPEWYYKGISQWKKLSIDERLNLHLDRLCKGLNGKGYTYVVFGD